MKGVRLAALDEEWAEQGVNIPTYWAEEASASWLKVAQSLHNSAYAIFRELCTGEVRRKAQPGMRHLLLIFAMGVPLLAPKRSMRSLPARLARLEEGDDLPVDVGEALDEDQVTSIVEDAQPGTRDSLRKRSSVGRRHVAVL